MSHTGRPLAFVYQPILREPCHVFSATEINDINASKLTISPVSSSNLRAACHLRKARLTHYLSRPFNVVAGWVDDLRHADHDSASQSTGHHTVYV